MSANCIITLLLCSTLVLALRTSTHMYQQDFYPTHQGFTKIKSPCSKGKTAVANKVPHSYNGCGSTAWEVKLGKKTIPFVKDLTPCCDQHDICYGTCGAPDFEKSFQTCNNNFKNCMFKVCVHKQHRNPFAKEICKFNANALYESVKTFGQGPYNSAQAKHCDCV